MATDDFLIGLVAVVAIVVGRFLAPRTGAPYAVFLVVCGAAGSFVPGVPDLHLDPRLVFLVFLPPLVYRAGFLTSPLEARANAVSIGLSALGLVLATTFVVAAGVHFTDPAFGWAGAVVLGACVAPTDPVAATTVLGRLDAPRRIATILEGEGLVNDGIALTLLGVGITAVGSVETPTSALVEFLKVALGGAALGAAVGLFMARLRRPTTDPRIQLALSLTVPYLAYVVADSLGLSGILATVVAGVLIGQAASAGSEPATRLAAESFWDAFTFLLESALFVLLGLQFAPVVSHLGAYSPSHVFEVAAVAVGAVVVTRLLWEFLIPNLRWRPEGRLVDTGTLEPRERLVLGWSGLRGAISFAAALSVPVVVAGRHFPERNLLLFATFCVIAVTLLLQGTTLPFLLHRTGLAAPDARRRQVLEARRQAIEAVLRRLGELAQSDDAEAETVEVLTRVYEQRLERATAGLEHRAPRPEASFHQLQRELVGVQRQTLSAMHERGDLDSTALREVLHDLDLELASTRGR